MNVETLLQAEAAAGVQIKARDGERPGIQAEAVRRAAVQGVPIPTAQEDRPAG